MSTLRCPIPPLSFPPCGLAHQYFWRLPPYSVSREPDMVRILEAQSWKSPCKRKHRTELEFQDNISRRQDTSDGCEQHFKALFERIDAVKVGSQCQQDASSSTGSIPATLSISTVQFRFNWQKHLRNGHDGMSCRMMHLSSAREHGYVLCRLGLGRNKSCRYYLRSTHPA